MTDPIVSYYDPPPIPMRDCDWVAMRDSYEPGGPIGYGATRQQAIDALLEMEELCATPRAEDDE